MAIVKGKQPDANTGRYYLICASNKTSLTYVYEVDADTFNRASVGLMYNPAKITHWKFISSQ